MKYTKGKLKTHYNGTYWEVHTDTNPSVSIIQLNPYHLHEGPERFDFEEGNAYAKLISKAPEMYEALKEISEAKGAYSLDKLEHCSNTVKNMVEIANSLLKDLES